LSFVSQVATGGSSRAAVNDDAEKASQSGLV
jgi:hypothetical protein